jgi:hypothetical protein
VTDLKCVPRAAEKTPHMAVFAQRGALRSSKVNRSYGDCGGSNLKKSLRFVSNYLKSFPSDDAGQSSLPISLVSK